VAGLASALTSLVKRAVQFIKAAASMQGQPAAADDAAAAYFPAPAPSIVKELFVVAFWHCTGQLMAASNSSSGSSSSSQVHSSAALLVVVLARSLVQLADAMEAAGPQLLHDSLVAAPLYLIRWSAILALLCIER
jgi:hypothetical protein